MLATFKDASLEQRSLDYAVSGKVRNQDVAIQLLIMCAAPKRAMRPGSIFSKTGTKYRHN